MTVKELIKQLQKLPLDFKVTTCGDNDPTTSLSSIFIRDGYVVIYHDENEEEFL